MTARRVVVACGGVAAIMMTAWWLSHDAAMVPPSAPVEVAPLAARLAEIAGLAGADVARSDAAASAAPWSAPAGVAHFLVTVLDAPDGQPVAGVEVSWLPRSEPLDGLPPDEAQRLRRDPERRARRYGCTGRSDANGRVEVFTSVFPLGLHARAGARYGWLVVPDDGPAPAAGHRLVLEPDRALCVQVLDADGQPAPGVPLRCVPLAADGAPLPHFASRDHDLVTEAPDGIAWERHLQAYRRFEWAGAASWRVRIQLPGIDDVGVTFDPAAVPEQPFVLRLPPTGAVQVRLVGRSPASTDEQVVILFDDAPAALADEQTGHWRDSGQDGGVCFAHVPLGRRFVVRTCLGGWSNRHIVGPSSPGEVVVVEVAPEPTVAFVAGRLLDSHRQPIAMARVGIEFAWVHADGSGSSGGAAARSDAAGRFEWLVADTCGGELQLNRLTLERWLATAPPQIADLPGRTLHAGTNEIGDVVLQEGPLLVSGRFDFGGRVRPRDLSWGIQSRGVDGATPWPPPGWHQWELADGRFGVYGEAAGELCLCIHPAGGAPAQLVDFHAGDTGLVVPVAIGEGLRVPVRMPPGLRPLLRAELRTIATEPLLASIWSVDGDRYELRWRGVPAGRYRLELSLQGVDPLGLVLDDVAVPAPPGGDARLRELDLRPAFAVRRLRLSSEVPLADLSTARATLLRSDGRGPDLRFPAKAGVIECLLPAGGADVLVACVGLAPQTLRDVREDREVRLVAWPEVLLSFPDLPDLPPPWRLLAALHSPTTDLQLEQANMSRWREVSGGQVSLPIGDGPHTLRLELHLEGHRPRPVALSAPPVFAGPGITSVDAAAAVRAAIAAATK